MRYQVFMLVALAIFPNFVAAAPSNSENCRFIAPSMNVAATSVAEFIRAMESVKYDNMIQAMKGPERKALIRMRAEARKTIASLKAFQKSARDATTAVQICGDQ